MLANGATLGYRKHTAGENSAAYTDLPGLKEIPEVGVELDKEENTCLTDPHKMYEEGIFDTLANIRRRLLREEKQRIMDNFIQAQAIAVDISALFAKDGKIAHPWDYYPELFEKEQKAYEEAEEARQWEEYMEKRRAYNAEWNYRHNH